MSNLQPIEMSPGDKLLVSLTAPPWCALYLGPAGFLTFPVFHLLFDRRGNAWGLAVVLCGLLLVVRFGAAGLRRFLPVSDAVRQGWYRNRALAKQYDSYQWRKLFWVGWGVCAYAILARMRGAPLVFGSACILTGGIAGLIWQNRKKEMDRAEAAPK
jgi:hypothetical protein